MSEKKPLKPYVVTVEYAAIVMAESEIDAYSVASDCVDQIHRDNDADISTGRELTSEDQLAPYGWNGECLPYGGMGDMTLRQIFEAMDAVPARDTETIDMFTEQA